MPQQMTTQPQEHANLINQTANILVYFSYPECQVCRILKPKVQELLNQYPLFEFLYIDINLHPKFKGEYMVFAVPTIILFQKGRELQRFSRHISVAELETYLERISQE